MSKHALLSPSGASRWMTCTPSAVLEAKEPYKSSTYADEGTMAHELGRILIAQQLHAMGVRVRSLDTLRKDTNSLMAIQRDKQYYSEAMLKYCYDYRDYVIEAFNEALEEDPNAQIFLEVYLDLSDYIPESFGTSDVIIISDHRVMVIDLKFGSGVPVSSRENKQMMIYALGAISNYSVVFSPYVAYMSIFQPRIDNTSVWDMQVEDLLDWGNTILLPTATHAFNGGGKFVAGDHCKFCRLKGKCREFGKEGLELAKLEFKEAQFGDDEAYAVEQMGYDPADCFLTADEIALIVSKKSKVEKWLNEVYDYAYKGVIAGEFSFTGLKLIKGSGKRTYVSTEAVELKLLASKFQPSQIYVPKQLLGITEMEKVLGKKVFSEYLGDLVVKSEGSLKLVDINDDSPEYNSLEKAIEEFSDLEDEDLV